MTTWEYAHERTRSTAVRLGERVRPWGRTIAAVSRRLRPMVLPTLGAGLFVCAGFVVSVLVGLVVAGLSCFFLEWRFAK